MNGSRNLSQSGVFKLCRGLRLSNKEADYLERLVAFNQAKSHGEKEHYYQQMSEIREYGKHQKIRKEQFEYFSQWYHAAIRSILPLNTFHNDYAALGKYLDPPISARQARQSVELLIRLGLVEKDEEGNYRVSTSSLTTGDEVKSLAISVFHKNILDLSKRSIDKHVSEQRDISGITMSVSDAGFRKIKSEIQAFRKKIMSIAESDKKEDRICQLSIQYFPLSKVGEQ